MVPIFDRFATRFDVERARAASHISALAAEDSRLQVLSAGRCHFVAEGFADRRYLPDGALVDRTRPDAFVDDLAEAVRQVEWLVSVKGVRTVCVHGDNPHALMFVRELRAALLRQGITLQAFA